MSRLIDADALLEAIKGLNYKDAKYGDWLYTEKLVITISNAPTVQREGFDKELLEADDGKWDATLRALWRRLQINHLNGEFWNLSEIPENEMYIFRAHFATALLASPLKQLNAPKDN